MCCYIVPRNGTEVAVVYYRTGYTPQQYQSDKVREVVGGPLWHFMPRGRCI